MSTTAGPSLRKRLKLAGLLLIAGLSIEALTVSWAHPTAFFAFALLGGTLVLAGVVLYLWSLTAD